ncbi:MAG TPA: hypothetical protein ENN80_02140 [Candidatus Hydrogenedentes bacterium]|nr:hypothetical protein [Candidatus Hydrogenedentota bacterium]
MTTVYLVCAIVGGVLLLCQLAMMLLGLAGDHDFDDGAHDVDAGEHGAHPVDADYHDTSMFFQLLSFRSLVAAVTFFGLAGMAATEAGWPTYPVLLSAVGAGVLAMIIVAWLMRLLYSLRAEGNVHIENAVGMPGSVYLTVPSHREGAGKVTVTVQNRTMEFEAFTNEEKLPTGTSVVVTGVIAPNTLEVERVGQ